MMISEGESMESKLRLKRSTFPLLIAWCPWAMMKKQILIVLGLAVGDDDSLDTYTA